LPERWQYGLLCIGGNSFSVRGLPACSLPVCIISSSGLLLLILKSAFIKPFHSLQGALDEALEKKGKDARVLFMLDGSLTVPVIDQG
jgi:hypothetical protein